MEEKAIFANIATILAKESLLDNRAKMKRSYPFPQMYPSSQDFEDDDDNLDVFVYESLKENRSTFTGTLPADRRNEVQKVKPNKELCIPQEIKFCLEDHYKPEEYEKHIHITKKTLRKIIQTIVPLIEVSMCNNNNYSISKESFVALGMWKLTTDEHFEEISRRFKIPLNVCHFTVNNFCNILSSNLKHFVRWPDNPVKRRITRNSSIGRTPRTSVSNLFGIIALRQIDIFLESQDEESSAVLQIVCSEDQLLFDCHVELSSAYSFNSTPLAEKISAGLVPENSYLIGDSSLPLQHSLMRPFTNPSNNREEMFNKFVEEKINFANKVLNKMAERFHSLYALEAKDLDEVKKILQTICVLHNFCQIKEDNYVNDCKSFVTRPFYFQRGSDNDEDGKRRRLEILQELFPEKH